eukprot:scaffold24885_cov79-Phaeocystis_antarctica.AAC.4
MRARPASPAAGSRWPMLALTLPTAASGSDLPSAPFKRSIQPSALISAATSVGSPKAVPVPCASSCRSDRPSSPARSSAMESSRVCAEPLGAVRLALLPSCWTAEPPSQVREETLSACWPATNKAPTPSPRT